jgi:hypothetical protein
MEIYLKTYKGKLLLLMIFTAFLSCSDSKQQYQITFEQGVDESGNLTKVWLDVIQDQFSKEELDQVINIKKKLSDSEIEWANLIGSKLSHWEKQFEDIAIPFSNIQIPDKISVVVGNTGKVDAFTSREIETKIFLNLSVLFREYGNAGSQENKGRIDRLFAHEFTHLLHYQWFKKNPYIPGTPLEKALKRCLVEGIGHYRSISDKWRDKNGHITDHAEKTLLSLEPVFVQRLIAIKYATETEATVLMQDLSMGRFNEKWGALTVALWLVKESAGDDKNLIKWINLGPDGILTLALNHLPVKLKDDLKSSLEL